MRSMAVDKNMKNTYEITIQDLRNEIESLKRKLEVLQRKVDQKTDDIRRKDDFIKTSIIGRMGKQES
jgi:prefoldin subunit 5